MVKTQKNEEKFIQIPKDFNELNDLKELVSNYEFATRLFNVLKDYQMNYINSFVMSSKEILKYIPNDHHEKYVVRRGDEAWEISDYSKSLDILLTRASRSTKKVFMPDTINQEIIHCHWLDKKNCVYQQKGIDFDIKDGILIVKVNFTEQCEQAIGGCWINGRANGYLSGAHYEPYERKGHEIHHYCTKTNQYLGYQKTVMSPEIKWISKTSQW